MSYCSHTAIESTPRRLSYIRFRKLFPLSFFSGKEFRDLMILNWQRFRFLFSVEIWESPRCFSKSHLTNRWYVAAFLFFLDFLLPFIIVVSLTDNARLKILIYIFPVNLYLKNFESKSPVLEYTNSMVKVDLKIVKSLKWLNT